MAEGSPAAFVPRKSPVQARSAATVEAIHEAAIQVLLAEDAGRLTTTRVAERAGVSVGTLYQYYPNKRALLFAVLEGHLSKVAAAVEAACEQARGKPLAEMTRDVVEAFVDAKLERADISTALYRIAAGLDGPVLARQAMLRSQTALAAALRTLPDVVVDQREFAAEMVFAAMSGATRSVLEAGAPPAMAGKLRHHLVLLCQSYLSAVSLTLTPRPAKPARLRPSQGRS